MKFAICNELFEGWEWPRVCRFVKETGYDGIEIAPFTFAPHAGALSAEERSRIRMTAEEAGLAIVGLHWLLAKTEGFHIAHPEAAVRRKTADYLMLLSDLCADLGGKIMVFGSPKQRDVPPALAPALAREYAKVTFQDILPHLAGNGITLCFEPLAPQETNFINTASEARKLVEEIGHPNFRLTLDVKAMASERRPIAQIIKEHAPWLAHFHANDPNLLGPGFGEEDFAPILASLKEIGYGGFVSVEVFDFSPGPEAIARESLRYLARIIHYSGRVRLRRTVN